MKYYVLEWDNEDVDEPWRTYLELDRSDYICRRVDFYHAGFAEYYEDLNIGPVDIKELTGEGSCEELQRSFFESAVAQVYELAGGFTATGMAF